ncbi:CBASS cGAMP-activated phospholipase [Thermoflavimicrobium daqui]|uniref:PNPLA domain-containing protein n=1 Tax=Thermoflavimicrobium daqui TaxID=2137476 RepID=A0A364K8W6_9BACL|nr:CBASS cGAMP-activated phospholipase [Thermoflavimicrobium daqui]RAL26739.1 hypothetical protein DL897_01420 [Thermoflavimicrobium daqui]
MIDWDEIKTNGWKTRRDREFRILSIDGGGMKGVFPARYLSRIEEEVPQPLHQYFDLIAGTSTGGIIALAVTYGLTAKDILDLYLEKGKDIFGRKRITRGYLKHAKYDNTGLINVLKEKFKDARLTKANSMVCIPAIEHHKAKPKVYKTPHLPVYFEDGKLEFWKIALATSAAPFYLPAAKVSNTECKIDGGLWANNPVLVAIAEAVKLGYPLEQIKILSIGTGTNIYQIDNKNAEFGGLTSWRLNLVEFTMQSQSKGAFHTANYLIGNKLHRIDYETSLKMALDTTEKESLNRLIHEADTVFQETFMKGNNIYTEFFS